MKYLLFFFLIVAIFFIYLLLAVNDDQRWFRQFANAKYQANAVTLKIDSLQYCNYRWRMNQQTEKWELYLDSYLKVDSQGSFIGMRHDTSAGREEFIKGSLDRIASGMIDSLYSQSLDTTYFSQGIYCGNTSHLAFAKNGLHETDYYQQDAPLFIQRLSSALDSAIYSKWDLIKAFDLSGYKSEIERQSLKRIGSLPQLQKAPPIEIDVEKYRPANH